MSDPTKLRFTTFNTLLGRFAPSPADQLHRAPLVLDRMRHVIPTPDNARTLSRRSSIYALQETSENWAGWLKDRLPGYLRFWRGEQVLLFDSATWAHTQCWDVDFYTGYHGAILAPLTHKATGVTVLAVSAHMPPWSKVGTSRRDETFAKLFAELDEHPRVLLGIDANSHTFALDAVGDPHGMVNARWSSPAPRAIGAVFRTHDPYRDGTAIDHILGRGATFRGYYNRNSGAASDHQTVTAQVTL